MSDKQKRRRSANGETGEVDLMKIFGTISENEDGYDGPVIDEELLRQKEEVLRRVGEPESDDFVAALEKFHLMCEARKEAQARKKAQPHSPEKEGRGEQLELLTRIGRLEAQVRELTDRLSKDAGRDGTAGTKGNPIRAVGVAVLLAPMIYKGVSFLLWFLDDLNWSWEPATVCITLGLVLIIIVPPGSPFRRLCRWLDGK